MGQKPYVSALDGGKAIAQVRSPQYLMKRWASGSCRIVSTMSDEFNVYVGIGNVCVNRFRQGLKTALFG